MRPSPKLVAIALVTILLALPSISHAWNIICGISISEKQNYEQISNAKWDADSRALHGIGLFFLAVSELQRIELQPDNSVAVPTSLWRSDSPSTIEAMRLLSGSANEIRQSLELAEQYGLGDDQGLGLLRQLHDALNSSHQIMASDSRLPNLESMHNIVRTIGEYVDHGLELSMEHLEVGLGGHGMGGVEF